MSQETVGEIDLLAARHGQRSIALVRHDAEHLHPFRLRRADAISSRLPTADSPGNALAASIWSMTTPFRSGALSASVKVRPGDQRRAQHFEVTRQHDLEIDSLEFARVGEGRLQPPSDGAESSRQRQRKRGGDGLDTGQIPQAGQDLALSGARSCGCCPPRPPSKRKVSRPCGLKPGSMRCSSMKLRNIRPDPISSTNESATSATTTKLRSNPAPPARALRPLARSNVGHAGPRGAHRRRHAEQRGRRQRRQLR
jgi:hypothetical protein